MNTEQTANAPRTSPLDDADAQERIGVPSVVGAALAAVTPLSVVAGVVPTSFAVTGRTGTPLMFLIVGAVLVVWSVGFTAMGRYIRSAGALYGFITAGLGRPAGVAAAWVALCTYGMLQVGLFGIVGAAAEPLLSSVFGPDLPWWTYAGVAWVVVAVMGVLRIEISARVMGVLAGCEVAIVVIFIAGGFTHPSGGHFDLGFLSLSSLFDGVLVVLAVLGFCGFEGAAVYGPEAHGGARTVRRAIFATLGLSAVLYASSSLSTIIAVGPSHVVAAARDQQVDLLFATASTTVGGALAYAGHLLFATSILAGMCSFQNYVARYAMAAAREQVLPSVLGRTSVRGAPWVASLVQSGLAAVVIWVYAYAGWDPLVQLFFWVGTTGGFGVLLLLTVTAVAVLSYFARNEHGEGYWRTRIAPGISAVLLAVMVVLALRNFATLLGVPPDSLWRWILPAGFGVAAALGIGQAAWLRYRNPAVYDALGRATKAPATAGPSVRRDR